MNQLKQELYRHCEHYIQERIITIQQAIQTAQQAAADDTKSSAGDKYETTRELMQQEISRNQAQLTEAYQIQQALKQINPAVESTVIRNGSLVLTDQGNFYLAIAAGSFIIEDKTYFAISSASPLGSRLMGMAVGTGFLFNGKEFKIVEVV